MKVHEATLTMANEAVQSASSAFDTWSQTYGTDSRDILNNIADGLLSHLDEIASLECLN